MEVEMGLLEFSDTKSCKSLNIIVIITSLYVCTIRSLYWSMTLYIYIYIGECSNTNQY